MCTPEVRPVALITLFLDQDTAVDAVMLCLKSMTAAMVPTKTIRRLRPSAPSEKSDPSGEVHYSAMARWTKGALDLRGLNIYLSDTSRNRY